MRPRARRFLAAVLLAALGFAIASLAAAQSSGSFRLLKGEFAAVGGAATSATFRLLESAGTAVAAGQSASTNFRLNGGVVLTDVAGGEEVSPENPGAVRLHQNFPNPFNPATTITYDLPHRATVSITISNALGEVVRTIDEGVREAGTYLILWNGENDSGLRAPSGVYYCRLFAGDSRHTRKMILLR